MSIVSHKTLGQLQAAFLTNRNATKIHIANLTYTVGTNVTRVGPAATMEIYKMCDIDRLAELLTGATITTREEEQEERASKKRRKPASTAPRSRKKKVEVVSPDRAELIDDDDDEGEEPENIEDDDDGDDDDSDDDDDKSYRPAHNDPPLPRVVSRAVTR